MTVVESAPPVRTTVFGASKEFTLSTFSSDQYKTGERLGASDGRNNGKAVGY